MGSQMDTRESSLLMDQMVSSDPKEQDLKLNYVSICVLDQIPSGSPLTLPASWRITGLPHTPSYFSKLAPALTAVCLLAGARSWGEPVDSLINPWDRQSGWMWWNIVCLWSTVTTPGDMGQRLLCSGSTSVTPCPCEEPSNWREWVWRFSPQYSSTRTPPLCKHAEERKKHFPFTEKNHHSFSNFNSRHLLSTWGPCPPEASISDTILSVNMLSRSKKEEFGILIFTHIFFIGFFSQLKPDVLWSVRDPAQDSLISLKVAESHRAGSPAGTAELNVASWLFASREPLERAFIWSSWKLGRGGAIEDATRVSEGGRKGLMGWRPIQGWVHAAAPSCSPWLGRGGCMCWFPCGRVWLHSLQRPHTDPSSALSTPGLLGCVPPSLCCIPQVSRTPHTPGTSHATRPPGF